MEVAQKHFSSMIKTMGMVVYETANLGMASLGMLYVLYKFHTKPHNLKKNMEGNTNIKLVSSKQATIRIAQPFARVQIEIDGQEKERLQNDTASMTLIMGLLKNYTAQKDAP